MLRKLLAGTKPKEYDLHLLIAVESETENAVNGDIHLLGQISNVRIL